MAKLDLIQGDITKITVETIVDARRGQLLAVCRWRYARVVMARSRMPLQMKN